MFLGRTAFAQVVHRRYTSGQEMIDLFVGLAGPEARVRSYLSPKVGCRVNQGEFGFLDLGELCKS